MSTVLLDANLLIALNFPDHQHHEIARSWLLALKPSESFATDPITEGALTRYSIRIGLPGTAVRSAIEALHRHPRWRFWTDTISYSDVSLSGVRGHKQVTDSYLAELARHYQGRVLTLDRPFAARCNDVVTLLAATA